MPRLLGKHDKDIISCADIEEGDYVSRSVGDFVVPNLIHDGLAQATTYTFEGGKGMVVIERHGQTIANFNFNILSSQHPLAQAFMPENREVAQIVSALVDEAFRGFEISRQCYSMLSRKYIVCSDEQQTLEGAALWYFKISDIDHITIHIVYRYDETDYTMSEWTEQNAWSGDSILVSSAIDNGIPATHYEDHSKTVFLAVSDPYVEQKE